MTYLIITDKDDAKQILFKIIWNIREMKFDYDYTPTKNEILNYIKEKNIISYNKVMAWDRERKLKRILKQS